MTTRFGALENTRGFKCKRCGKDGTKQDARSYDNVARVVVCRECATKMQAEPYGEPQQVDSDIKVIVAAIRELNGKISVMQEEIDLLKEKVND